MTSTPFHRPIDEQKITFIAGKIFYMDRLNCFMRIQFKVRTAPVSSGWSVAEGFAARRR